MIASPSLNPSPDEVKEEKGAFLSEALSNLQADIFQDHWKIGTVLCHKSARWGEVVRVEFTIPGAEVPGRFNRVVCWRTDRWNYHTAYGQQIPPLAGK